MSHYFDPSPQTPADRRMIQVRLAGQDFQFMTDHDVFSRDRLDYGTQLLIETVLEDMPVRKGRLLDLGCGYGAVGIIIKRICPAMDVVMSDINQRALELARHNAGINQTRYLDIVCSDGLTAVAGSFAYILSNPPIRAGKSTVYRFFDESASRLQPDGILYIVIRKQQGAPSALTHLRTLFRDVRVIGRSAGYWIMRCQGQPAAV